MSFLQGISASAAEAKAKAEEAKENAEKEIDNVKKEGEEAVKAGEEQLKEQKQDAEEKLNSEVENVQAELKEKIPDADVGEQAGAAVQQAQEGLANLDINPPKNPISGFLWKHFV